MTRRRRKAKRSSLESNISQQTSKSSNTKKRFKVSVDCGEKNCEWISDDILCGVDIQTKHLKSFEQDPRAAVLVYHSQSGLLREYESSKDSLKVFCNEHGDSIDEEDLFVNTESEQEKIRKAIRNFNEDVGQETDYVGCPGCGEIFRKKYCKEIILKKIMGLII